ncbi:hypothetical protein RCL1_005279 [Eukaryota sp. TZLM3-RCL]
MLYSLLPINNDSFPPIYNCEEVFPIVLSYDDIKKSSEDLTGTEKQKVETLKDQTKAFTSLNSVRRLIKRRTLYYIDYYSSIDISDDRYSSKDKFIDRKNKVPETMYYADWSIHPFSFKLSHDLVKMCTAPPSPNILIEGLDPDLQVIRDVEDSSESEVEATDREDTDDEQADGNKSERNFAEESKLQVTNAQQDNVVDKILDTSFTEQISTPSSSQTAYSTPLPSQESSTPSSTPITPTSAPSARSTAMYNNALEYLDGLKSKLSTVDSLEESLIFSEEFMTLSTLHHGISKDLKKSLVDALISINPQLSVEGIEAAFKRGYSQNQKSKAQKDYDNALRNFLRLIYSRLGNSQAVLVDSVFTSFFKKVYDSLVKFHKFSSASIGAVDVSIDGRRDLLLSQVMSYINEHRSSTDQTHWSNNVSTNDLLVQWNALDEQKAGKKRSSESVPITTSAPEVKRVAVQGVLIDTTFVPT